MLKVIDAELDEFERQHAGIKRSILAFEADVLPPCPHCSCDDVAVVQAGIIGRTIAISAATSKFQLMPNGGPGKHFCNSCRQYFD